MYSTPHTAARAGIIEGVNLQDPARRVCCAAEVLRLSAIGGSMANAALADVTLLDELIFGLTVTSIVVWFTLPSPSISDADGDAFCGVLSSGSW